MRIAFFELWIASSSRNYVFKVEKLLQAGPDGLYLVKNSTEFPGDMTLCVSYESSVHYFRVRHLTTEHRSRTILQDSALAPQQNPAISSTLVACSSKFPTDPLLPLKKSPLGLPAIPLTSLHSFSFFLWFWFLSNLWILPEANNVFLGSKSLFMLNRLLQCSAAC